jgi:O-antigen/teichoic acid export membrane protein
MGWAYGSYVGGRILVLVSTAVLARLLTPEDFGIVALAITFMALLEGVADLGLSDALIIQADKVVRERAQTVFVSTVALGAVLSGVIAALSPLASRFFDEPELTAVAAALGANFFLRSLGQTHYALAQRELNFRARTVAEFSDVLVRGSVGVVLAILGFGVWSLVIGYLIGTISLDVAIWRMVDWRPSRRLTLEHFRDLIGFGGTLSAVTIVATLIANMDYLFIGRVLGPTDLGLYTLGFRLPELLILNLSVVAGQVLFPAFSAVKREDLGHVFLIALRYTVMLGLPMAVGLAVLAKPFVLALFGDQWLGSVDAMRILTIYALGVTIGIPAGAAYKATGRAGVLLILGVARLALVVAGLALFVDRGILAAATTQAIVAGAAAVVGIGLAARLLSVGLPAILREVWPTLAAAGVTAAALLGVLVVFDSTWGQLIAGGVAGTVVYIGTLAIIAPLQLAYIRERMRRGGPGESEPETGADPEVRARDEERVI